MESKIFREYRFKFYLNANHYLIFGNKQGETHPHTWEFALDILISKTKYVEFGMFERAIEQFFAPYQNSVMNHKEPFDSIVPTLENMVEYFSHKLRIIVKEIGGELIRMEGSETPTRSYIIDFYNEREKGEELESYSKETISGVIDSMIDDIIG
ncbi:MAG: 6-carboxytetrahydropterin synthase [Lachnospiraceae bacterium]